MKKRIMALLLSLVMALSLVPTTVWAAGASSGDVVDNGIATQASMSWNWTVTIFGGNYYSSDGTESNTNRYTTNKSLDNSKDNEIGYKFEWNASAGGRFYKGGWQLCITVNGSVVDRTTAYVYTRNMSTASGSWTAPGSSHTGTSSHPFTLSLSSFPKETNNCNHDYVWKDNGDGTHTGTCKNCNDKVTEGHNDNNGDGFCDKCGACVHDKDNKGYCTVKDCQHIKDGKNCCQKENPAPTEPAAPTGDELKEAIGKIQVKDTVKAGYKTHNTEFFDLIDQSYTMTDVADSKVTVTIAADKYVAAYNVLHPNHTNAGVLSVALTLEKSGDKWSVVNGKTPVTFVVECNEEEGPGETEPNFSDAKVIVKCVANNDNHKTLTEKQYSITEGAYTANYNHENGHTCTVTLNRASFIGKFGTDTGFTHKDKDPNTEITFTWTWIAKEKAWKLNSEVAGLIECECETTPAKKETVRIVIYRNGDTTKAYKTYNYDQPAGTVIDLTKLNIGDYYTANYTGKYDSYGWYNDGTWNVYKKNLANPPAGLTTIKVNGWTNIIAMVYDYEKVVYFQTKEALADYQKDHSKTEGLLFSTTARVGTELPTADAPTAKRTGYKFTFWSKEGQTSDVTGQTVGGWTNLYANWEKKSYDVVGKLYMNGTAKMKSDGTSHYLSDKLTGLYGTDINYGPIETWAKELALELDKDNDPTDATVKIYKDGGRNEPNKTFGDPDKPVTYVWADVTTYYKVTFDTKGGDAVKAQEVKYGDKAKDVTPTWAGYTFKGWYTDENYAEGTEFDFKEPITKSVKLYAQWEITPHNIYAFANLDSTFIPLTPREFEEHITLNPATLTRLGLGAYNTLGYISIGSFRFNGMPLTEEVYMVNDMYNDPEVAAVATALKADAKNLESGVNEATVGKIDWTALFNEGLEPGYPAPAEDKDGYQLTGNLNLATVMFRANGDDVEGMPAVNYTDTEKFYEIYDFYFAGDTFTMPADPERTGYDFKGWSVKILPSAGIETAVLAETNDGLLKEGDTYTITEGGVIFTAQWEKQTYTVKFDSMGGSKIDDQKVKYQDKATEPKAPTKSGYTFAGWYTDKKCTTKYDFANEVTGNMTLYAKWDVKRTGTNPDAKNPYIKDNTKKDDGKKVESGKTFDAGIAMYVGLSILSVTGSAVVIRKRKDF